MPAEVVSNVRYHVAMDTTIAIEVPGVASSLVEQPVRSAFRWFDEVERVCSRFDPASELSRLSNAPGTSVVVSELLYAVLEYAVEVARASDGAFDPTVGAHMTRAGFDRNFRTGARTSPLGVPDATYLDIGLNAATREVTLARPLMIDLGAVAKGFAIDLAAHELNEFPSFAINAGGDIYLRGTNADGQPWSIGVRDPRDFDEVTATFSITNAAVCTSGDYERRAENGSHHILDPNTSKSAAESASVTVIAPSAMAADSLATAAFVLGPVRGTEFLEENGVEGLIITTSGERFETTNLSRYLA